MIIGIDPSLCSTGISDGTRHALIKTKPDNSTTASNNLRRSKEIVDGILAFIGKQDKVEVWIEGPMLNVQGASHLYDIGFLYCTLYNRLPFEINEVQPTTLKKYGSGNGNTKKELMPAIVKDRFGIEFEKDSGQDKLHAFLLAKYGEAVKQGTVDYTAPLRRGLKTKLRNQKKKAKAASDRRDKSRS